MNTSAENKIRLDKWLWATRWCKTRREATEACQGGAVKQGEQTLKPSRNLRIGEEILFRQQSLWRTLRVTQLIQKRVSATLARECYQDLTPAEEIAAWEERRQPPLNRHLRGTGRPTKKDRRDWEKHLFPKKSP